MALEDFQRILTNHVKLPLPLPRGCFNFIGTVRFNFLKKFYKNSNIRVFGGYNILGFQLLVSPYYGRNLNTIWFFASNGFILYVMNAFELKKIDTKSAHSRFFKKYYQKHKIRNDKNRIFGSFYIFWIDLSKVDIQIQFLFMLQMGLSDMPWIHLNSRR